MAASVYVSYFVGAVLIVGLVYLFVFKKGPETEEGYEPSYQKDNEDISDTQIR